MDQGQLLKIALLALLTCGAVGCVQGDVREVRSGLVRGDSDGRSTVIDLKVEKYESLMREFPDEPRYRERLARLYWMKKDHRNALRYLDQAAKLDPENPKYAYLKGTIYAGIKNYRLAEASFKEILDGKGAKYTGPYIQLAEICLQEDRPDQAFEYLSKCAEVDPDFSTPHYYLGMIWFARSNQEKGIHHFEEYLRLGGGAFQPEVIQALRRLQPNLRIHHIR